MQIKLIQDPREITHLDYQDWPVGDYVRPEEPLKMFLCGEGIREWFDVGDHQSELTLKITKRPNRHAYKCRLQSGSMQNHIRILDPSLGAQGRWTDVEVYRSFKDLLGEKIGKGDFYISMDIPT